MLRSRVISNVLRLIMSEGVHPPVRRVVNRLMAVRTKVWLSLPRLPSTFVTTRFRLPGWSSDLASSLLTSYLKTLVNRTSPIMESLIIFCLRCETVLSLTFRCLVILLRARPCRAWRPVTTCLTRVRAGRPRVKRRAS